jgi:uncharacterized membrane protein YbhN (UPF0104 family)
VLAAAGLAVVFLPGPSRAASTGLGALEGADPAWLVAAGIGFLCAALASAAAWHRALTACGATLRLGQVVRRYGTGSLANTLAPAHAGEAVRVALISRAVGTEGAAFTTIGVAAAVSLLRAAIVAVLFVATVARGASLVWLAPAAAAVAVVSVAGIGLARRGAGSSRLAHLLDVARAMAASPLAALELCAWVAAGVGARVLASACAGAAVGLPHPVAAALVIVPALELAGLLPLTPGNIGLTSAAVAVALRLHGVPLAPAVGVGIGLHAVETLVGLGFGGACALSLVPRPRPLVTRMLVGTGAAALLVGAVASTLVGLRGGLT